MWVGCAYVAFKFEGATSTSHSTLRVHVRACKDIAGNHTEEGKQ